LGRPTKFKPRSLGEWNILPHARDACHCCHHEYLLILLSNVDGNWADRQSRMRAWNPQDFDGFPLVGVIR
jgi:hypothetical protein